MPGAQQEITILPQMANDIGYFMGREPGIDRNRHIVKPEFGFLAYRPNMNVRGLVALVRIKEGAIGSPAQNRRHVTPYPAPLRADPLAPLATLRLLHWVQFKTQFVFNELHVRN
jgi:hypothetical protein